MPVINRIAAFSDEMATWRRHLHENPELGFDCFNTAAFVKERLSEFGVDEIHDGIATTGIVAIINGAREGETIGLRADMDALPIFETSGVEWTSKIEGKMHACGHDGHTTMLLGAAKYLAETRNFSGRVALIFQPAEEGGAGGDVMVKEGILDRFDISQVYALHNSPDAELGAFFTAPTALMAAADTFSIKLQGRGGHGAYPQDTVDPVVGALAVANAIQTIVSRNHSPHEKLVVSITQIHAGTADNIIPEEAFLQGTVRTFDKDVQAMVMRRMQEIVDGTAAAYGLQGQLDYAVGYPATINDPDKAAFACEVAKTIAGEDRVQGNRTPEMGAEDFSYLLEKRPGAYLFLGIGEAPGLHHPAYDFNDEASASGASFFAKIVETAQPL